MGDARPDRRIRKRAEYLDIQASGRRVTTPSFVLLLRARASARDGVRFGITVSRKVGGAVARNRAKRLIREAFRSVDALFADDVDVVVIVRRPLGDAKLADVIGEWQRAKAAILAATRRARGGEAPPKDAR